MKTVKTFYGLADIMLSADLPKEEGLARLSLTLRFEYSEEDNGEYVVSLYNRDSKGFLNGQYFPFDELPKALETYSKRLQGYLNHYEQCMNELRESLASKAIT